MPGAARWLHHTVRRALGILAVTFVLGCAAPAAALFPFDTPPPDAPATPMPPASYSPSTPYPTYAPPTTDATGYSGCSSSSSSSGGESARRTTTHSSIPQGKVLSKVDTDGRKQIALTLDDGYNPHDSVISYIEEHHLRGTAFIVGQVADSNPAFVHRIADMGWMVCSHTYDHKQLTRMSDYQVKQEITKGADAVANVVGYHCPYFRAPFGSVNTTVVQVTDELGLKIVGWDASLSDSSVGVYAQEQIDVAMHDVHPGSVLLGHWGGTNTLKVLSTVLENLEAQGYTIGSVSDLLGNDAPSDEVSPAPAVNALTVSVDKRPVKWNRLALASIPGVLALALSGFFALMAFHAKRHRKDQILRRQLAEVAKASALVSRNGDQRLGNAAIPDDVERVDR